MRKFLKTTIRVLLYVFGSFLVLLLIVFIYLMFVAIEHPPKVADESSLRLQRTAQADGLYTLGNNWFRKSRSGLYELYVAGEPFERGVINGKLTQELVRRQEDHFNEQIRKIIPSDAYLHFLKYFVGWFNRNLADNVPEEYKDEIYGVSEAASSRYNYIGSNYQRILNYHAAHDIGHALQSMALVGCTSFGTWDGRSADSTMIIGRNFDFYVGDKFAEEKIVAFFTPSKGYKMMTVTWGGFIGVVSGMNEKGLAVTINAAKTNVPSGSATPVSLVAREILQYAKNIDEALAIARKRKMFVSESFLVASAEDDKAVVIEKTPEEIGVYDPRKDFIVCANHFQSNALGASDMNRQQVNESASPYRYQRMMQLLDSNGRNTVQKTVDILRNRGGLNNQDIGLGNEKAINQLLAHHSVVFEPQKRIVWVSTAPWQLGEFVAYDLNKVFALEGVTVNQEIADNSLTIGPDPFLKTPAFQNYQRYLGFKQRLAKGQPVSLDSLVASNPQYFHTYVVAGDYLFKRGKHAEAEAYYRRALTKEVATRKEVMYIEDQIKKCIKNKQRA